MIRLEHLRIQEFRGIRSLDLTLAGKTFVVYGPNGSGKSGVVDAIDFALTGRIGRLEGEGTRSVSARKHGPHVLRNTEPAAAKVTLKIKDTVSNKTAKISRSLEDPTSFSLEPDTPAMRIAVEKAANHPELTLSRRELLKYIIAKPGQRATEIQALLKLDHIESFRKAFKSTSSKADTASLDATKERDKAKRTFFKDHLSLSSHDIDEARKEINKRREVLGLTALIELTETTDLLQGSKKTQNVSSINLRAAREDFATLHTAITDDKEIRTVYENLQAKIKVFTEEPSMMDTVRHRKLFNLGLDSIEGAFCPLCNLDWKSREDLEAHLASRIAETKSAQKFSDEVIEAAKSYSAKISTLRGQAEQIRSSANEYGSEELKHFLQAWITSLSHLEGSLDTFEAVTAQDAVHSINAHVPSIELRETLASLGESLNNAPDQSQEEAARTFIALAKEHWASVCVASASYTKAAASKKAADAIYEHYCTAVDESLTSLYKSVEQDFSRYYQLINADDEKAFRAELIPSSGSLDLQVDFYQQGMFPPVAYHSEGHQDGMGVCLYLALVKRLLGSDFKYAVLDDVVMSVDSNHRRHFAELLKTEFDDVQFIITTHDEFWARQMRSVGLTNRSSTARFHGWTIDAGPIYGTTDVWESIEAALDAGDVPGAAHKLRRALEAKTADIVENIGGSVTYRSDATYDLSTFLDSINKRYKELLDKASKSAQSWNNPDQARRVKQIQEEQRTILSDRQREFWLLNTLVHNNNWANATEADFRPVIKIAKDFLSLFRCENPECESWITVSGQPGSQTSLDCTCKTYFLNLERKKKNT